MTKAELVAEIAKVTGSTKQDSERALNGAPPFLLATVNTFIGTVNLTRA